MPTAKYDTYKIISFINEYRKERKLELVFSFFIVLLYLFKLSFIMFFYTYLVIIF